MTERETRMVSERTLQVSAINHARRLILQQFIIDRLLLHSGLPPFTSFALASHLKNFVKLPC
jgi:hypothetical protein